MIIKPENPVRMALVAGPGAGKTTLATAFNSHMKNKGYNWYYVSEYARDFIDNYGQDGPPKCGPLVQLHFVDKQWRRELSVPKQCDGFITDSPVFLAWFYSALYGNSDLPGYLARKNNYKAFLRSVYEYTHIVLVKREKGYVYDGTRAQSPETAMELDKAVETMLKLHGIKYHVVSGTLEERVKQLEALSIPLLKSSDDPTLDPNYTGG